LSGNKGFRFQTLKILNFSNNRQSEAIPSIFNPQSSF